MTNYEFPPHSGLNELLGLEWVEATPDIAIARFEIDDRHRQPYGIVHGGTWCSLVEALASTGAAFWALDQGMLGVVGLSNTTDFLRSHREGPVRGTATPIHRGRTQQIWQVVIERESDSKDLARGQLRLQNITDPAIIGGLGDLAPS